MACTETYYIESASSLQEKVTRYAQIITALENQIINVAAGNADVEEYLIDDGQVKISTKYRDVVSIAAAIIQFEKLKNIALNKLNGRSTALRNWRGLS